MRGELVVCHCHGLSFDSLPASVDALCDEIASHKRKIISLENRVGSPTVSLDALRNQFIGTFETDKPASDGEADRRIISAGNAWAHGGDVVVDAW